ncbi:Phox domain-containing protein [Heterostelium album PN500]|uniref:Phox domain-containing protein n=1 Tax=Heterostelium pallidum (strain ATCC 26659 / Pp 5 / PN500) TaxID=670386 RepID=D3BIF5_HETP5|nr:Phox domain-containing protein [Heterostelium album PN500]EFA79055.1 Phox domain-containing protein [Heterostelium album PN500]|eukprot:XP_020431178.1 Phox domain-containing protein [Heterostelium album PN500]
MKKVSSINNFFKRSTSGTNSNGGTPTGGNSGANSPTIANGSASPGSQTPPNLSNIEYEADDHVFSPAKITKQNQQQQHQQQQQQLNSSHSALPSLGSEAVQHHPLESSGSSLSSSGVSSGSIFSPRTSPTSTPILTRHIVEQYPPVADVITPPPPTSSSSSTSNSSTSTSNNTNSNGGQEIIKSALIVSTDTVSPDKKPYTVYKVQVETNKSMYIIWRRYSEFLDIDLKLRAAYPLSRLPFPPKKTFGKMNNEFIEQRKDHLQQFVNALFTHPTLTDLPCDPIVVAFFHQNSIDQNQLEISTRSNTPKQSKLANDQVVRYIISTLPFWSDLLDYGSLLSLTETYSTTSSSYNGSPTPNLLIDGINSAGVNANGNGNSGGGSSRDLRSSSSSSSHQQQQQQQQQHLTMVESMEYSRQVFLQLLATHYHLRTSSDSHKSHRDCDCLAPKFRGTIIGIPNITGSFLQSFNTEFQNTRSPVALNRTASSIDLESSRESINIPLNESMQQQILLSSSASSGSLATSSSELDQQLSMVSHIVSNGRMLCVSTSDSSNLSREESRFNLSLCHFVLLAFSLIDMASFESIGVWVEDIKMMCPESPIILVGLQRDLREASNPLGQSITYQQGLDKSKQIPNCLAYIESPSASDGVGGWRRSLLSELASQLINHYREVFVQHTTKKSNYTVRGSFLSKIFPRYPDEIIHKGLTSYDGDVEKALELLALDYANYSESNEHQSTSHKRQHLRSQSVDTSSSSKNSSINSSSSNLNTWIHNDSNNTTSGDSNNNNSKSNNQPPPHRQSVKIPESQINTLVEKLKKNSVDSFIKGFLRKKNQTQDQQAEMVLSFLREMRTQLQSSQLFSSLNVQNSDQEEDLTSLPLGEIENYLYQNIYKVVFSTQESLEKDVLLSDRMSKLVFVEPQHLEINQIHWNKDLWLAAEKELHSVNDLFSPSQKLEFLLSNSDSPGGADDFLPHLIYVVIHANVPNLYSNFEFTSKFCNSELLKMERYYYFTTFGIAVTFIEGIDSKHLKIDAEEYEAYMSGKKKYVPEELKNKQKELEEIAQMNEASRAKIMQKLGIDETTATVAITSPTKKKPQLLDSEERYEEESIEKAISEEKSCKQDAAAHTSTTSNEKENPFESPSASIDGPLLPIQWATSAPTETNKRNSVKGMSLSRTPSPPDSKSLQVEEHPLAFNHKSKSEDISNINITSTSTSTTTTSTPPLTLPTTTETSTATNATTDVSPVTTTTTTTTSSSSPTMVEQVSQFSSSPMENSQPKPNEVPELPPIEQPVTITKNTTNNDEDNIDNPLDLNHNVIIDQ